MLPKLAVKLSKVLAATGAVMPKAEETMVWKEDKPAVKRSYLRA